jgi:hypothetical protein
MSAQRANAINGFLRTELLRTLTDPRPSLQPRSYLHTDLFATQLESRLRRIRKGRERIAQPVGDLLPRKLRATLEKLFGRPFDRITRFDLLGLSQREWMRLTGLSATEIARLRLAALGVEFTKKGDTGRPPQSEPPEQKPDGGERRG